MKNLAVIVGILALTLLIPSTIMADYNPPADTIDIPNPVLEPCDVDAGSSSLVDNPQTDEVDCGDPCVAFHAGPSGLVDNPQYDPDKADCGDPCVAFYAGPSGLVDNPQYNPDKGDCGDPCVGFHAGPTGRVDNPSVDPDLTDCGDPCLASFSPSAHLAQSIAFYGSKDQTSTLDQFLTPPTDCGDDEPKKEKKKDKDEPKDDDGDGTLDNQDNCPGVKNPDQSDNFGTEAGDACEDTYTSNNEILWGFVSEDSVGFYGFCDENDDCQFIGYVQPSQFNEQINNDDLEDAGNYDSLLAGGKVLTIIEGEPTRMTVLFAIGTDLDGNIIFQVNMYEMVEKTRNGETYIFPYLVDDNFTIIVNEDGSWEWFDRIPN